MENRFILFMLFMVVFAGCVQEPQVTTTTIEATIGGERDEHGCLIPAGYSWNEEIGACVREWELNETQRKAAKKAVAPISFYVTVVEVETGDCAGCFTVHLQRNDNQKQYTVKVENLEVEEGRQGMSEEFCNSSGGHWNECGSRCSLDHQGENVACTLMCEQLCECGGLAGFSCPQGYKCEIRSKVMDALGYCIPEKISYEEARTIAENSDCVKEGTLKDEYMYNNYTYTWWIDMEVEDKENCNPACVVWEETLTAEINWRCTGLNP